MYESFNDEKRALFCDIERYCTIANLWREFSLYLIAKKTNYHRYKSFYLTTEISIKSRRGGQIGSGLSYRVYGGLALLKKTKWYRRKQRVLIIDHSEEVSCDSLEEKPEDFMDKNPVIIGMDLDLWETVESALSAVRGLRERLEVQKTLEKEHFKQRIIGHSDSHND